MKYCNLIGQLHMYMFETYRKPVLKSDIHTCMFTIEKRKKNFFLHCRCNKGHTKLILCFTDFLGQKHDPVGRQKNKNKNDQTSHEFN